MLKLSLGKYVEGWPGLKNWARVLLRTRHPVFLEYPVQPRPRYGYGQPPHARLSEIINRHRERYRQSLTSFLNYQPNLVRIPLRPAAGQTNGPAWVNRFLPGLDSVALYSLLGLRRPRRYVEIGSGHSTRFARQAIADHALPTHITSIDPRPWTEVDSICDRVIRQPLEQVSLELFDELEAGDILFMDGSHYLFMNSDSTIFFLDILDRLKPGVLIQLHDIFLPYDYAPQYRDLYYSEQYWLAASLLAGDPRLEILLPNAFITHDAELRAILSPLWADPALAGVETHGVSFWLVRR